MTPEEVDELWVELIQDDYYLDYLKSVANLKQIAEEKEKTNILTLSPAAKWVSAAAAIVVIAASLVFVNLQIQSQEMLQPLSSIELDYYRSAEGNAAEGTGFESVRQAILFANQGDPDEAILMIDRRVADESVSDIERSELMLTAGSILYNNGQFEQAISRFERALQYGNESILFQERVYWYLGNAHFQMNNIPQAVAALQVTFDFNGAYSRIAQSYLKALTSI
ncbi:MAG: tetratricopeptide repeat protein [Balneolaceae bacterium]